MDALSLLLSLGNAGANSDVLLVDMVGGILTGAVAERLGGLLFGFFTTIDYSFTCFLRAYVLRCLFEYFILNYYPKSMLLFFFKIKFQATF